MVGLYCVGLLGILGLAQSALVPSEPAYIENIRNVASPRIVGGWEAVNGQFPYTVSLRMVGGAGGVGACTGSILTNNWILTAAHCLARRFSYVLRLGQVDITRPGYILDEGLTPHIHEAYDQESTYVQTDDIGLLELDRFIPYGEFIQPIRIQSSQRKNVEYGGVQLTLSGYGRDDDWWAGGIIPDVLLWVYQRGITLQECRTWYPTSQTINVQTMCSQFYDEPSQNACTGDSGGPLTMVDLDGKVTQVGIMSFGSHRGCNTPNPQGFVRPEYYQDWIENIIGTSLDWDVQELETRYGAKEVHDQPIVVN